MSRDTATSRDVTFVPDLGDTGTVSSLHFGQMGNDMFLAAAEWNNGMDLINISSTGGRTTTGQPAYNTRRVSQKATESPCLAVQIDTNNRMVIGSTCDGTIQAWLPETNALGQIGSHNSLCTHIRLLPNHNVLVSSGYDGFVKYWDVRSQQCVGQLQAPSKIIAMDAQGDLVVAALTDQVLVIDIRKPQQISSTRRTNLSEAAVSITAMYNNEGYVVSSLDSRARVEFINKPESDSFIFRAHRVDLGNQVFEAHAFSSLACHPIHNTLATCGTDGSWATWDFYQRQRLTTFERLPNPISAGAYSPDGTMFAFSSSYNWFKGANSDPARQNQPNPNLLPKIGILGLAQQPLVWTKK